MNETVLGLLSALAIYGLAALALPQAGPERVSDPSDLTADVDADAPDPVRAEDSDSQVG